MNGGGVIVQKRCWFLYLANKGLEVLRARNFDFSDIVPKPEFELVDIFPSIPSLRYSPLVALSALNNWNFEIT